MTTLDWLAAAGTPGMTDERPFRLAGPDRTVPGVLWLPAAASSSPPPLVLLGHGGSGHKRSERVLQLARWFTAEAGMAAAAIDGPYHGDRVPASLSAVQYRQLIASVGAATVIERMVEDWQLTIQALTTARLIDGGRLGYLGMSMGTRFGLPLAASLGERVRCLVIGKFGLEQAELVDPRADSRLEVAERMTRAARAVTVPTAFHLQWHDEIFPRSGQLALFDLLGSADKRIIAFPGRHRTTPAEAIECWQGFVARHLR